MPVVGVDLRLGLRAGIQIELDGVGRIIRRVEFERAAAARIHRQVVAGALIIGRDAEGVLEQVLGDLVVGGDGRARRQPGGKAADLAGDIDIAVHQGRRDGQHVGYIVEAIAHVIDRQILAQVDIESQKIAHRIAIFGAVQTPQGGAARIGRGGGHAIQRTGQPTGEIGDLFLGGALHAARRHFAQAYAAQDFFPDVVVGAQMIGIQRLHRHASGLRLVVMTARAILQQHGLAAGRGGGRRHLGCGLGGSLGQPGYGRQGIGGRVAK